MIDNFANILNELEIMIIAFVRNKLQKMYTKANNIFKNVIFEFFKNLSIFDWIMHILGTREIQISNQDHSFVLNLNFL